MDLSPALIDRCESKCELCGSTDALVAYRVKPKSGLHLDHQIATCAICSDLLDHPDKINIDHWRCLNESIWSITPAVQVVSYRILNKLRDQAWALDLLGMIDLDAAVLEWAHDEEAGVIDAVHKDANGALLLQGDSVVLIQDLNVKGANFVAKRGTAVRRITLVNGNPEQIEGKVNDQHIVILTKYVKKVNPT
jgi:protein PhnA